MTFHQGMRRRSARPFRPSEAFRVLALSIRTFRVLKRRGGSSFLAPSAPSDPGVLPVLRAPRSGGLSDRRPSALLGLRGAPVLRPPRRAPVIRPRPSALQGGSALVIRPFGPPSTLPAAKRLLFGLGAAPVLRARPVLRPPSALLRRGACPSASFGPPSARRRGACPSAPSASRGACPSALLRSLRPSFGPRAAPVLRPLARRLSFGPSFGPVLRPRAAPVLRPSRGACPSARPSARSFGPRAAPVLRPVLRPRGACPSAPRRLSFRPFLPPRDR